MPEDVPVPDISPVEELRNEMSVQFQTLKESFEKTISEKNDELEKLASTNKELQTALVRSAMMDKPQEAVKPSPEDEYKSLISEKAKLTLDIMQKII